MRFASVHLLSMLVSMYGVLLPLASTKRLYARNTAVGLHVGPAVTILSILGCLAHMHCHSLL